MTLSLSGECLKCLTKTGPNSLCSANHPPSICVPRKPVGKSSIAVREACHAGGNPLGYAAATFSSFTLEDAVVAEAEDAAMGETEECESAGAEDAFSSFGAFTLIASSSAAFTLAAAFCAAAASSAACLTLLGLWAPESSANVPDASRSFSLVSASKATSAGNPRWRCHHRSRRCPCFCRKLESQRGRINGGWESHRRGQQRGSVRRAAS